MQFTLRQRYGALILLWLMLTVLCALAGPFGTLSAFSLPGRTGYWAVIVGGAVAGSVVVTRMSPQGLWSNILIWGSYILALALGVHLLNAAIFGDVASTGGLIYLIVIVGMSVAVINGLIHLAQIMGFGGAAPAAVIGASDEDTPDPSVRFLRRVPVENRGPLIRIEAQDHYLNVVTKNGSSLILLRLGEAVEELAQAGGLQTHRSHWINLKEVTAHRRTEGRDMLEMSDGTLVPVARTRRDAARAAGLF